MKDAKIPAHQVDVVEIMKKIRQTASTNRVELSQDEKVRTEVKGEFATLMKEAKVPDFIIDEIRQQTIYPAYDPRTLYASSRPGFGSIIGFIRKLLKPITKLFINLDPLAHEVNRLTILNNFYMKTVQDLITKNAAMRIEIHSLKNRHRQRYKDERFPRHSSGSRRFSRDRQKREGNDTRNGEARNYSRTNSPESRS